MEFKRKLELFEKNEHELDGLDEGWAKAALAFRTGERFGHADEVRCMSIKEVHDRLERRRKRLRPDSTLEILHAIALCAEENMPLPSWLAKAFLEQFGKFVEVDAQKGELPTSLDELFKSPNRSTNTKVKAKLSAKKWREALKIWNDVRAAVRDPASPEEFRPRPEIKTLNEAIEAARLDGHWGYSMTVARELFELIDLTQHELAGTKILSDFLPKSRNKGRSK